MWPATRGPPRRSAGTASRLHARPVMAAEADARERGVERRGSGNTPPGVYVRGWLPSERSPDVSTVPAPAATADAARRRRGVGWQRGHRCEARFMNGSRTMRDSTPSAAQRRHGADIGLGDRGGDRLPEFLEAVARHVERDVIGRALRDAGAHVGFQAGLDHRQQDEGGQPEAQRRDQRAGLRAGAVEAEEVNVDGCRDPVGGSET